MADALANIRAVELDDVSEEPGRGISAQWRGQTVALRRPDSASGIATALVIGSRPVRLINFADQLRPDAAQAFTDIETTGAGAWH